MSETTAAQHSTKARRLDRHTYVIKTTRLLELKRSKTLTVRGQAYEIIEFPVNEGLNLEQAIALTDSMRGREMLTSEEAQKIVDADQLQAESPMILWESQWTFVRDLKAEKRGLAAILANDGVQMGCGLAVYLYLADKTSNVLVLKNTTNKARTRIKLRTDTV